MENRLPVAKKSAAKSGWDKVVVLITCPNAELAGELARALVDAHLAACVNVLASPVGSIYRWKGSVEHAPEHLLIVKTAHRLIPQLESLVKRRHTYKIPEIIALPIVGGSFKYLKWVEKNLLSSKSKKEKKSAGKRK
ncbi:MAG: divalent-cation tolerance protein CutA [Acidobacteria bacterium]|nr:divalent-cation tolerance protein CutA [Acidobacteriota bacterium]